MTRVIAADVVIPLEVFVVFAQVPIARRIDAVHQATVVQHRQVKSASIPRNDLRGVFINAVKEALDDFRLTRLRVTQSPHFEMVAFTHRTRNGADAMQV